MASGAAVEGLLVGVAFPADRNALLVQATRNRASGDQLAAIIALPDRTYTDRADVTSAITGSPSQGRVRGTVSALMAAGLGAAAVRTLVRQVAKRSLGPVGLVITAAEAAIAVRSGVRAVSRWRADRQLRREAARR
jgi:hypothetical protein